MDKNIRKTLELLVMLQRGNSQTSSNPEDAYFLNITRQLVTDAGLTVPEFTNTLHAISEKGYIWHMVVYDEKTRQELAQTFSKDNRKQTAYNAYMKDFTSLEPAKVHELQGFSGFEDHVSSDLLRVWDDVRTHFI